MGDLQFAKQFLATLDNKPTKYQPEHVFDPKTFQLRVPYVLPKLSSPPHPAPPKSTPTTAPAPGAEPAEPSTPPLTLVLKSARNPNMTFTLPQTQPTTTLQAIKEQIQTYLGGSDVVATTEKIKLLLNKKPVAGSKKTVSEALEGSDGTEEVEFGVMIMGGAPDPPPQAQPPPTSATTDAAISITAPASEKAAAEAGAEEKPDQTPMEGIETSTSEPLQPGEASGQAVLESPEFWTDLQGFLEQRIRSAEEAERMRGVFERAWRSSRAEP